MTIDLQKLEDALQNVGELVVALLLMSLAFFAVVLEGINQRFHIFELLAELWAWVMYGNAS